MQMQIAKFVGNQVEYRSLGCAESRRKIDGHKSSMEVNYPMHEPFYQRTCTELQAELGQAAFDRCWQKGRTLTVTAVTILIRDFAAPQPLYA